MGPSNSDSLYSTSTWAPNIFVGKVVFCTGGAGSICSVQVKALVGLGANAAIIGRRENVLASVAKEIQAARKGSRVIGISADVRSIDSLKAAVARTVAELGRYPYTVLEQQAISWLISTICPPMRSSLSSTSIF